ncbi:MAG TPA: hypothetical protein GX511_01490, partial [Firmicutes bacterium]|nr:hypothetical protein [Bacillota bacterium]
MDLIWSASALFLTLFLRSSFGRLLKDHGAVKPNYSGQTLTFPWGVLLVLVVSVIYSLRLLVEGWDLLLGQSLLVCYGAGFLGLVDDLLGDAGCRGLRGHIRAFWAERKLTSGLIKAAGGLLLALILGSRAARLHGLLLLGLNLALAMNALNLLDVRPGRAGKGFLLFWLLLYLVGSKEAALKAGLPL